MFTRFLFIFLLESLLVFWLGLLNLKINLMLCICNPTDWEAEAGQLWAGSQPQLYRDQLLSPNITSLQSLNVVCA